MSDQLETRQPADLESEAALLGAILIDHRWALDRVRAIVRARDFYDSTNRGIFETICRIADAGHALDPVILAAYIGASKRVELDRGAAGQVLLKLMDAVPTAAHAESYAQLVRERADRREAIGRLHGLVRLSFDLDSPDPVDAFVAEALDFEAGAFRAEDAEDDFEADVGQALADYDTPSDRTPWGIVGLDAIVSGSSPGTFNVLAARPGGGKTTFALELLRAMAAQGHRADFASLEMGKRGEIMPAILCGHARISHEAWIRRQLRSFDLEQLQKSLADLAKMDIGIFEPDSWTFRQFQAWAHRRAAKGSRLIVLDYLQLLEGDDDKRTLYEQTKAITRGMKLTAKRIAKRGHDCRFLVLSQMNREIEKAKKRKPVLSDLRESGTLEQDADAVWFLHSDEKDKGDGQVVDVELIIAKSRGSKTGTALLRWDKERRYFTDLHGIGAPPARARSEAASAEPVEGPPEF